MTEPPLSPVASSSSLCASQLETRALFLISVKSGFIFQPLLRAMSLSSRLVTPCSCRIMYLPMNSTVKSLHHLLQAETPNPTGHICLRCCSPLAPTASHLLLRELITLTKKTQRWNKNWSPQSYKTVNVQNRNLLFGPLAVISCNHSPWTFPFCHLQAITATILLLSSVIAWR